MIPRNPFQNVEWELKRNLSIIFSNEIYSAFDCSTREWPFKSEQETEAVEYLKSKLGIAFHIEEKATSEENAQLDWKIMNVWAFTKDPPVKRFVFIVFKGTKERHDLESIIQLEPEKNEDIGCIIPKGMTVHFTETDLAAIINSYVSDVISALSETENIQVIVTGHSLGGAYAQIMGAYLMNDSSYNDVNIEVYTFASPQVFQRADHMPWAERMQNKAHHFVVSKDPVPMWQTCRISSAFGQGMKLFKAYKKRDSEDLLDTLVTTSLSYLQAQQGQEENILDYQQFGTFWMTEESDEPYPFLEGVNYEEFKQRIEDRPKFKKSLKNWKFHGSQFYQECMKKTLDYQ